MALYEPLRVTKKGKSLLDRVFLGIELKFTKIALSSAQHTGTEVETLHDVVQEFAVTSFDYEDVDHLNITAVGNNRELKKGYYAKCLGVYANDPIFGEILVGLCNADPADYISAWSSSIGLTDLEINIAFAIRDCDTVHVTVQEDTWASQKALNDAIAVRPVRYVLSSLPQVYNTDYFLDLICIDRADARKKIDDLKAVEKVELLEGEGSPFRLIMNSAESAIKNAKEHSTDLSNDDIAIVL